MTDTYEAGEELPTPHMPDLVPVEMVWMELKEQRLVGSDMLSV